MRAEWRVAVSTTWVERDSAVSAPSAARVLAASLVSGEILENLFMVTVEGERLV